MLNCSDERRFTNDDSKAVSLVCLVYLVYFVSQTN